jgi:hypothetical protein
MSLWHCTSCSTAYAVGLPACPHCRSTSKEEDAVPKNTKAGGPSYEGHVDVSSPDTAAPEWAPEVEAEPQPEPVPADEVEPAKPERRKRGKTTAR